jgi:hypothetical protein
MPGIPSPQPSRPAVPTMTNASLIPPEAPPRNPFTPAEELSEDITALQMGAPDFANDIKPFLRNPGLHPRWIFTDRRRFAQAKAQGWRVATKADLKLDYTKLSPFEEEGGTKYINGDLILMLIDRKIYLGALRYKHQVAAALSDAAVQRRISGARAANEMGSVVAAVNAKRAAQGADPIMTVFAPGAADFNDTILGKDGVAAKELGRMGGARDTGSLADLARQADDSKT